MRNLLALTLLLATACTQQAPICRLPDIHHPRGWSSKVFYEEQFEPSGIREAAIVKEFLKGNYPERIKKFLPVHVPMGDGSIEFSVTADYLAVGTNEDFVRTPMSGVAAQVIAGHLGMTMPTRQMVDWIYQGAKVKLEALPQDWFKEEWKMRFGPNYVLFNLDIEAQRLGREGLVAGHKKDVVITNRLDAYPERVAIYGWQDRDGQPIQPLSTVHANWYEDYSHGVRLVGPWVWITDAQGRTKKMNLIAALKDPEIGNFLNGGEGALRDVRAARSCPKEFMRVSGYQLETCPPQPALCY